MWEEEQHRGTTSATPTINPSPKNTKQRHNHQQTALNHLILLGRNQLLEACLERSSGVPTSELGEVGEREHQTATTTTKTTHKDKAKQHERRKLVAP